MRKEIREQINDYAGCRNALEEAIYILEGCTDDPVFDYTEQKEFLEMAAKLYVYRDNLQKTIDTLKDDQHV